MARVIGWEGGVVGGYRTLCINCSPERPDGRWYPLTDQGYYEDGVRFCDKCGSLIPVKLAGESLEAFVVRVREFLLAGESPTREEARRLRVALEYYGPAILTHYLSWLRTFEQ